MKKTVPSDGKFLTRKRQLKLSDEKDKERHVRQSQHFTSSDTKTRVSSSERKDLDSNQEKAVHSCAIASQSHTRRLDMHVYVIVC